MTPFTGSGELLLTRNSTTRVQTKKNYLFFLKKSNSLLFSLFSLFSLFALGKPLSAQLFTQRHDARYALSLVCLFIYAKRFITREEYDFVSARLSKRFCVAVFASGGFFSLSSTLLRALFVVLSLLWKEMGEKKVTRSLSLLFGTENAKMFCAKETRIA